MTQTATLVDAGTALLAELRRRFVVCPFFLEEIKTRRWSSATFSGARHDVTFRLEGEDAEREASQFLASLNTADFSLKSHLLADISLVSEERRPGFVRIHIEALTVEDR